MKHFKKQLALTLVLILVLTETLNAQDLANEVADLQQILIEMKNDYENRITELEKRLDRAERSVQRANKDVDQAMEIAEEAAISATAGVSSPNIYNPAIGAVLVARYANIDSGNSGFSLGESEINMKASVDSRFFGNLTMALEDEGGETEVAVEEAWIQTIGLSNGLTLLGGRYFSGVGYLNKFHRHADDFGDRPLPYQEFLGGQYTPDGLQLRWIAPTSLLLEFGTELNWGNNFPSTGQSTTSPDTWTFFANLGGDISVSHSWQLGLLYLSANGTAQGTTQGMPRLLNNSPNATAPGGEAGRFNGDSDISGLDFVWKWAPDGNSTIQNFKFQGEYFNRNTKGYFNRHLWAGGYPSGFDFTPYEPSFRNDDQDGWYLQGIWQFQQGWRIGYRHDKVNLNNGLSFQLHRTCACINPTRDSFMIDWSPSEFSRLRMQFINDRVRNESDSQFLLQYIMSIGAHGSHEF
jgi:hypothetical protein